MAERLLRVDRISDVQIVEVTEQASSPATPASGKGKIYSKNDSKLYYKDDSGTEHSLMPQDLSGYQLTSEKNAANGYAGLGADSKIALSQIPLAALERLTIVADQTARYALTTATVQNGDSVKQLDTNIMYVVVDDTNLGNSSGYVEYAAGTAASVPWSGITGMDTQVSDLAGLSYAGNALKVIRVNAGETGWELATVAASGANTSLSNLVATAINQDLVFDKATPVVKSKDQTGVTNSESVTYGSGNTVDGNSGQVNISAGQVSGTGTRGDVFLDGNNTQITADTDVVVSCAGNMDMSGVTGSVLIPDVLAAGDNSKAANIQAIKALAGGWYKIDVNYSYFTAAALTETKALVSGFRLVEKVIIRTKTQFAAPAISALKISVGISGGSVNEYVNQYDAWAAPAATNFSSGVYDSFDTAGVYLDIKAEATGGNLSTMTAGDLEVLVKFAEVDLLTDALTL